MFSFGFYFSPYAVDLSKIIARKPFNVQMDKDLIPCTVLTIEGVPVDVTIDYSIFHLDKLLDFFDIKVLSPEEVINPNET